MTIIGHRPGKDVSIWSPTGIMGLTSRHEDTQLFIFGREVALADEAYVAAITDVLGDEVAQQALPSLRTELAPGTTVDIPLTAEQSFHVARKLAEIMPNELDLNKVPVAELIVTETDSDPDILVLVVQGYETTAAEVVEYEFGVQICRFGPQDDPGFGQPCQTAVLLPKRYLNRAYSNVVPEMYGDRLFLTIDSHLQQTPTALPFVFGILLSQLEGTVRTITTKTARPTS